MVSVGILGIMSLGIMSMTDYGFKSQAAVEQKFAANALQSQIYNLLENNNVCNLNFGTLAGVANQVKINVAGSAPTPVDVVNLKRTTAVGDIAFEKYNNATLPTYENKSLRINSMQLTNFQPLGNIATTLDGQYDLVVIFEKNKSSSGVVQFAPRTIKIKVKLAAIWDSTFATANKINTCIAFGGSADQIWTKNADSTIYYNGANVGIGTTNPKSLLDIYSPASSSTSAWLSLRVPGIQSSQQSVISLTTLDDNQQLGSTANNRGWAIYGRGQSFTGSVPGMEPLNPNNRFGISYWNGTTWGTQNFSILPNGNVGIGTTTPASRLDVFSSGGYVIRANSDNTDNTSILIKNTAAGGRTYGLFSTANTSAVGPGKFSISDNTASNAPRLVIDSAGNVGIGTTVPVAKLDIFGGGLKLTNTSTHNVVANFVYSNTDLHAGHFIGMRARGTAILPSYPIAGDTLGVFSSRDAIDGYVPNAYGGGSIATIATEDFSAASKGTRLQFKTTSNGTNLEIEKMTLLGNGNVGIGTTVPQAKLHVAGLIRGQLDCRTISATGPAPAYFSDVDCAADEYVMSGGGQCGFMGTGFGGPTDRGFPHISAPRANGWSVDCWDTVNNRDVPSRAFAICCKKGF